MCARVHARASARLRERVCVVVGCLLRSAGRFKVDVMQTACVREACRMTLGHGRAVPQTLVGALGPMRR